MHNRFKIFISMVVVAMFLGTGLASGRGTADRTSSNAAGELSPAFGEVVNTWSLSGRTCAPSSASSESTVALKIDVTSFSESSGAGPTVMYFVVNGKRIHSTDVDGTGVYTYNWSPGYANTTVNFHAEYLSGSEFMEKPSMHYAERRPMVFFRNSYSTLGNSDIYITWLQDCHRYMGYDGNKVIYLSNACQPTENIYGNISLPGAESSGTLSGGICKNIIIGNESYTEFEGGDKLIIEVKVGETGAGKIMCSFNAKSGESESSYPDKMTFSIEMSGNGPEVDMLGHSGNEYGMNITSSGRAVTEENDEVSLMLDGISLVPGAGYVITGGEASMTAYNLIHCLTSKDVSCSNNEAGATFNITGGNYSTPQGSSYVRTGQNVYSAGTCAYICIPNSDLSVNRTLTLKYQNYYVQGSILLGQKAGSEATETINAVTASAIYGCVNETGYTGPDQNINNQSLYIQNVNNGDVYNVAIHHGRYLFFAQPNTEYKFYSHINGSFKSIRFTNHNTSYSDDAKEVQTPNAGNSINVNFDASDFT
ncbi:MAG: hypothetical protein RE471_09250 [Ferroplasma sp.]|uniref:hypothetical protein n=1 Tax=Ferroplasma sp. TaxID=2591003 RepID=UPI002815904B|nr:hypothetical protein [Ferroplasma sp.]WMT51150.1 MAG: hypothetical protein RE471_09250 [Ferroplasma sp.]